MSDTEQIVGTLIGVMEKPSGWTQVQIGVPGKQYPVKADTKKQEIIDAARAVGSEVATWTIKTTESENINPNTGNPYKNRYLEAVELGANAQAPAGGNFPEAHHEPIHPADKERAIVRQACLKAAASVFMGTGVAVEEGSPDIPLQVMKAADRFERWVWRDIDETPFDQAGLSPADDDIPF